MYRLIFVISLVLGGAAASSAADPDRRGIEFFEGKIRPVLVKHCYACHSSKAKKVQGGLLLDSRARLRKGGETGPAIVPGKIDKSLLLQAMRYDDLEMPPEGKLPAAVIADFEKWIKMGAPDPRESPPGVKKKQSGSAKADQLWSFQPIPNAAPPVVKDKDWPRGDIDRYILARLETAGLKPGPDSDRRKLLRRVYFNLIGLPPSPEAMTVFLDDSSGDDSLAGAFAKVVDRLLASRHFGERWGRHWLDVVRYADSTGGGRTKIYGNSWRYRDYVIESFHRDKPYNEFVAQQIAGDLMPFTSPEQRREQFTALGFLVLGPTNYELQDKELLRMEVVDEQIDTMGRAFLGMSIGCARCHDHKFDPIPTADYYALAGIFRSTKTLIPGNVSGYVERTLPMEAKREEAWKSHQKALAQQQKLINQTKAAITKLKTQLGENLGKLVASKLPGIVVDDAAAKVVGQWTRSTSVKGFVGAVYLHDGNSGDGNMSVTFTPKLPRAGLYEVRLSYTAAENRAARAPVTVRCADGEKMIRIDQRKRPPIGGTFLSLGRYRFEKGTSGAVIISNKDAQGHVIADAVQFLSAKTSSNKPSKSGTSVAEKGDAGEEQRKMRLRERLAASSASLKQAESALSKLKRNAPTAPTKVMAVVDEAKTEDYYICIRGDVRNLGQKIPRGFLSAVHHGNLLKISPGESGRLQLARWLASRDNPLTARVMVNRIWQHLFGAGFIRTPDNFGRTGESPSHPRLLDHLAVRFMEQGWSVKRVIRQIVLSRVYQLSSQPRPVARKIDPENRLLSHANRRRLDAEAIRDAILSFSGQLDFTAGGTTIPSGTKSEFGYKFASLRRSVYVPVFRNRLHELLEVFDFPNPNMVAGRRNISTLPTQALYLMNSPFVMDQARHAAERLLAVEGLDEGGRIELAYRKALGRPPSKGERDLALRFTGEFKALDQNDAAQRLVNWSGFCQSLIACLDFRYLD